MYSSRYYWNYNYNFILFSKSLYLELLRSDTRIPRECWSCCRCSDSRRIGIACRRRRDCRRTTWSDSRSTGRVRRARNRILRALRFYIIAQYHYTRIVFPRSSETLPVRNCSICCPDGGGVVTAVSHLLTQSCSLTKLFSFPPHPP